MERKRIALITDSTADLPADVTVQNQIFVVPIAVVVDGQTMEDGDAEGGSAARISRQDFYIRMPQLKSFPTTAAPPPAAYTKIFEKAFAAGYEYVVSIALSSDLSATYNSAVIAAEAFKGRVFVLDSKQVTLGLGFQVLEAAEQLAKVEQDHPGQDLSAFIPPVLGNLVKMRRRERVIALVDTLEYLRRGGRVSWTQAALGSLLHVKVLVEVLDGKVVRLGRARTRRLGLEQIRTHVKRMGKLKQVGFVHSGVATEEIQGLLVDFLPQVEKRNSDQPLQPTIIDWLTPVVGAHTGTNTLAVIAVAWEDF